MLLKHFKVEMKCELAHVAVILLQVVCALSFAPADYLEVYPDPTDPAVLKGRTPLHIAVIKSQGSQFNSFGAVAGVKLALDMINNDSSLLPGYTLHYTLNDCQCNGTQGLTAFFSQILNEPTKLAVLGAGCSVSTEATASISYFYNIPQISCTSSSARLRDRVRFPYYFQLLSSEDVRIHAYHEIILEYGWKRVALIVQNENLFTVATDLLKTLLNDSGVEYSEVIFDTDRGITFNPFQEDYRIIHLAMYEVQARQLLCKAHAKGIRAPQYVLLTVAWYSRFWWRVEGEGLPCSADQREQVLLSTLAFTGTVFLDPIAEANLTASTGITASEFLAAEQQYLGEPPLNLTYLEYSQYCYDATYILAYALNKTISRINEEDLNQELAQEYNVTTPFGLNDFTYTNSRILNIMYQYLRQTYFYGFSGPVQFDDTGIRKLNRLVISQYRSLRNTTDNSKYTDIVQIGNVVLSESSNDDYKFVYADNEDVNTVWKGLVPYDGIPEESTVTIHLSLTVVVITLASLGIIFAVVCLIFNFIFRNTKLVKLASTKLNYLIGIGAIILYLDTVFFVIPTIDPEVVTVFCNLTPWLTAIGYSLCYGTILAKMARVYYIFNNPTTSKKNIKDWMLILAVGLLVGVDVIIIFFYTLIEGLRGNLIARLVPNGEMESSTETELAIKINFFVYICDTKARDIFLGILYGYKMVLQGIALVIAFSIRKVKVKGLNDAKYIGASIYVTSIVLAVIIVATYSLKDAINGFAVLFCAGFLIGTTVILILVFVPLMVGLYKDPKGDTIFRKQSTTDVKVDFSSQSEVSSLKRRIKELEENIKQNEKQAGSTPNHESVKSDGQKQVVYFGETTKGSPGTQREITVEYTRMQENSNSSEDSSTEM